MTLEQLARAAAVSLTVIFAVPLASQAASLPALPPADAQFDAGSLHVARFGHGDAVVLLPGLTTGPWEFADLIRRLAPRYTVYAVSLPGFDGRPGAAPPLFERFTGDFWSMLVAQKIVRPVLIGHSIGGTLSILLGEQHPDRLRGIVSIDGLPLLPGLEGATPEQRAAAAQQGSAAIAALTHQQLLDYDKSYMNSSGGVLDAGVAAAAAELMANSDPPTTAQWLREDLTTDLRADLAKITIPLLEIVPFNAPDLAGQPLSYTEEQKVGYYRTLLSGAPKLQIVSVSPARHFAMLDQPEKVFALVDAFLTQAR
jgi:pimeloyl-ACP methyl ester carboxylesterase